MQSQFLDESRRHWKRSVGLWCVSMVCIAAFAANKPPRTSIHAAEAALFSDFVSAQGGGAGAELTSGVTVTYAPLDLTALNLSAYGDLAE